MPPSSEEDPKAASEAPTAPDESTALLLNDVGMAPMEDIAKNRHTVAIFAAFNILFGLICVAFPLLASETLEFLLTSTILFAGCFHLYMFTTYKQQSGGDEDNDSHEDVAIEKAKFLILGVVLIFTAFFLFMHKFGTLTFLTIVLAIVYIAAGSYEIFMARNKHDDEIAAKGLILWSGVISVVASLVLVGCLPLTSWSTIGFLLGANHLNIGISRCVISWYGYRITVAGNQTEEKEAENALPKWMA